MHDGFELVFTKPLEPDSATALANYSLKTFTYIYQSEYGSPEVDHTTATVKSATISDDQLRVRLVVDGLQIGHIHHLELKDVVGVDGEQILHPIGYYTLNYLPSP